MTHLHDHDTRTTVVEDREGPATAFIVLAVAIVLGFLIWLVAFSGVVIDRDGGNGGETNIEQQFNPPAQDGGTTTDDGGTTTEDGGEPAPSP